MLEIIGPAKYQHEIDHLVSGSGGLHGLHHRLAWALMPQCIRYLVIAGLMLTNHPDETINALLKLRLNQLADQNTEAHQ